MGLFGGGEKPRARVLVDIGIGSVAGAYTLFAPDGTPTIVYSRRFPVEAHTGEAPEKAVLRALKILADTLIREGAPALARVHGSGRIEDIVVSIDAPWEKTSVHSEYLENKTPFTFTKGVVAEVLERSRAQVPEKMIVSQSVIGTILNGYETTDPYGKEAHRAEIVVLTSLIDEAVAKTFIACLEETFHTRHVRSIAGNSLRYQALRALFPHERDTLIVDATGPLISIALVRKNLFVAITDITDSSITDSSWVGEVMKQFAELAKQYPLPRTIFLLARPHTIESLQASLEGANMGTLWLSDTPPKVIGVLASHLSGLVRQGSTSTPDILLSLMALYAKHHEVLT